jgi:hypothetical protein
LNITSGALALDPLLTYEYFPASKLGKKIGLAVACYSTISQQQVIGRTGLLWLYQDSLQSPRRVWLPSPVRQLRMDFVSAL